ncbi:MAG TPA: anaerobic ribonucleoside-triphosphate reductase activating protein [Clostridiales bacterium]|nr:anaerobic ribonucleoside-triphosphate reductase activating protein [Clostridiales bacterium]
MNIAGLVKSSTVDFPGQLAAVIFTAGCNLDCFYCHNRLLLTGSAPRVEESEVMAFLNKRRGLLDGVVFSGGEPTLQPDLADWIRRVRDLDFKIKLDTNGTRPEILNQLISEKLLDYVAIDCKAPWERYPEICDCPDTDVEGIKQSLQILRDAGLPWEIRTTVIPQLNIKDLQEIIRQIPPPPRYFLQRYNRPAIYRPEDRFRIEAASYTPAQLVLLAEQLRKMKPEMEIQVR